MKQRIITSIIGLAVFFAVLVLYNTIGYNVVVAVVSLIAVYELLTAVGIKDKYVLVSALLFGGAVPFFHLPGAEVFIKYFLAAILTAFFVILLARHDKVNLKDIATAFFMSFTFPLAFTTIVLIRDKIPSEYGMYYFLMVFAVSWGSDSGAYFVGKFFGKHKLAPVVSPNKTVEGMFGGVLGSVIVTSIVTAAFHFIFMDQNFEVNYLLVIVLSIALSFVSVLGDLCCSVIKRQYKVKDFGTLFPGHGGVMDRFDSVSFVAPALYMLLQFFQIIS